jgi:hypothetical protein
MKQNIGIAGRYVRLVTGILALNCSVNTQRRNHLGRNLLASLGAMKVAEGVIGWCPTVELCNKLFPANESPANSIQNKVQAPQTKAHDSESEHDDSGHQAHHSDDPGSQRTPELKLAEPKVQSDKHESIKEPDSSPEVEAF